MLFIAGCGRSGTTLLLRLMYCFQDIKVITKESPFSRFKQETGSESVIVIKRDGMTYKEIADLPKDIHLIYSVRHPFDVMTSFHPRAAKTDEYYIKPERWLAEYRALKQLRRRQPERKILYLRYEDLVAMPDEAQDRLCAAFPFLRTDKRFTETGHEIKVTSTDKWKQNPQFLKDMYKISPEQRAEMIPFFREFSYDYPRAWAIGVGYFHAKELLSKIAKKIKRVAKL